MKKNIRGDNLNLQLRTVDRMVVVVIGVILTGFLSVESAWAQPPHQPNTASPTATLKLSLKEAVAIALAPDGNIRVQLALESIRAAQARSAQVRASLLPNLDGSVGQQNQTRNLEALGIRIQVPIPGFQFPTFVGPFNTFDARAYLSQSLCDFSAIRRFQAGRAGVQQAKAEDDSIRDQTREQVSKAYLAALRAGAALDTAQSNVALAEAILQLALNQKEAGTGIGIDVTRAKAQLSNERQRLIAAQNERNASYFQLLRNMGLTLEAKLELTDQFTYTEVEAISLEDAIKTALGSRSDWKAQQKREQTQSLNYSATKMERLPSIVGLADYGTIGTSAYNTTPTRTYGVAVRVPVFDGGRRDARTAESYSHFRQEAIRTRDLRQQIELELRLALDNLQAAAAQVKAAEEGLKLAEDELAQARRRYEGGVSNSLEVTDAQVRLSRAREIRVAALFIHNLARLEIAASTGTIRQLVE
jgi:outer membrane protein